MDIKDQDQEQDEWALSDEEVTVEAGAAFKEEISQEEEEVETEQVETKESEESEETGEEDGEVNLFENFEVESEKSDQIDDSKLSELSELLGTEVTSIAELKERLNKKPEVQAPVFANDEIKSLAEKMNKVASAGGDYRVIQDNASKMSVIEGEQKKLEGFLEVLNNAKKSTSIETKKEYLKYIYQKEFGLEGELAQTVINSLEEKTDDQIILEAHQSIASQIAKTSADISEKRSSYDSLKASNDNAVFEAEKNAVSARKIITEKINNYKDADSSVFTDRTQVVAQKAFSTKQKTYSLPEGVAELLFTTDGNIDLDKIMSMVNHSANGKLKRSHLEKLADVKSFRKMRNQKTKTKTKDPVTSQKGSDSDGFDEIIHDDSNGMTVEYKNKK